MIDEKKLISELEKWMNDTAYLKEKYSGSVQFKDGAGDNIIYDHAEIAHDIISTVIDKINEQKKDWKYTPESKVQEDLKKQIIRCICGDCDYCQYYDKTVNACNHESLARKVDNAYVSEWNPCSERLPEEHEETKDVFDIYTLAVVDIEHHMVSDLVIVTVYDYYNNKVFVCNDCTVDGKWCNFPESSDTYDVLAWMPMPEPYKEKNNE